MGHNKDRIVKLPQYLQEKREILLSKQILKSGTSIGALLREAKFAQSTLYFINKLSNSSQRGKRNILLALIIARYKLFRRNTL